MDKLIEDSIKDQKIKIPIIHIDQKKYLIGTQIVSCESVGPEVFVANMNLNQFISFVDEKTMADLA